MAPPHGISASRYRLSIPLAPPTLSFSVPSLFFFLAGLSATPLLFRDNLCRTLGLQRYKLPTSPFLDELVSHIFVETGSGFKFPLLHTRVVINETINLLLLYKIQSFQCNVSVSKAFKIVSILLRKRQYNVYPFYIYYYIWISISLWYLCIICSEREKENEGKRLNCS